METSKLQFPLVRIFNFWEGCPWRMHNASNGWRLANPLKRMPTGYQDKPFFSPISARNFYFSPKKSLLVRTVKGVVSY